MGSRDRQIALQDANSSECVHGGGEPKGRGVLSRGKKSWLSSFRAENKEGQKDFSFC